MFETKVGVGTLSGRSFQRLAGQVMRDIVPLATAQPSPFETVGVTNSTRPSH